MRVEAPLLPEERPFDPSPMLIRDGDYLYNVTPTRWAYRAAHIILPQVLAPNFTLTCKSSPKLDSYATAEMLIRHPIEEATVNINLDPEVISDFFTNRITREKKFSPTQGVIFYPQYKSLPKEGRIVFIKRNLDALYVHELDHLENHNSEEWLAHRIKNKMKDNKMRIIDIAQILMQLTNIYAGLSEASQHDQSIPYLVSRHTAIALLFLLEAERSKRKVNKEDYLDDPWEVKARQKVIDMVEKGVFPGYFDVELAE